MIKRCHTLRAEVCLYDNLRGLRIISANGWCLHQATLSETHLGYLAVFFDLALHPPTKILDPRTGGGLAPDRNFGHTTGRGLLLASGGC